MDEQYFRIYRSADRDDDYLGRGCLFLVDRPGSLAEVALLFAACGLNIIFFHYNRTEHPNRVLVEVRGSNRESLDRAAEKLVQSDVCRGLAAAPQLELSVTDIESILTTEVQLEHRPGALGEFAHLLAGHRANVIYMAYHEDVSETSAHFSIATQNPSQIDVLLREMNERGYYYSIAYRGAEQRRMDDVIGLNLVERFFFRLRKLLNIDDVDRLRKIVHSSQKLSESLVQFSREAGKYFDAGEVCSSILAFASASVLKTGNAFSYRRLPPVVRDGVRLHVFRLPTGGNVQVLESDGEIVMIDGGYGLYYDDVKNMLRENGLDPGKVGRIYLSHADADHAGMSGYFAEEFGSRVFLHGDSEGILREGNRAWGSGTSLMELNRCFTLLVNEFTKFRVPSTWIPYSSRATEWNDGFPIIDRFELAGLSYLVLGSEGGHIPGQVFFLSKDAGLVFTADYLLRVGTLSQAERDILNLPKFMMTSTNVDSRLFRHEMNRLRDLIVRVGEDVRSRGKHMIVVPGHGDYYDYDILTKE